MSAVGGPAETGPSSSLTRGTCVGCHSSTDSSTIKVIGSSRIPVVYNTVAPVNELAGGNFYWVVQKGAEYGHNVMTIPRMTQDGLTTAPGSPTSLGGICASCHDRIADCTSCHYPYHHGDGAAPVVGSDAQTTDTKAVYYRFLANGSNAHSGGGVMGIEDSDWEQTKSPDDHNVYAGGSIHRQGAEGMLGYDDGSMANYCAGCHTRLHNIADGGSASPWLRHPNNYCLPDDRSREYYFYNSSSGTGTGPYNPDAPVARQDILAYTGDLSTVRPGEGKDQVFCLSCHRPHGTPYKDILRWAYSPDEGGAMIAGTTGAGAKKGCFICHTTKDGL
ncbi:MAG: cytochrome c3 family protein [Pseudomonadota bacterium]